MLSRWPSDRLRGVRHGPGGFAGRLPERAETRGLSTTGDILLYRIQHFRYSNDKEVRVWSGCAVDSRGQARCGGVRKNDERFCRKSILFAANARRPGLRRTHRGRDRFFAPSAGARGTAARILPGPVSGDDGFTLRSENHSALGCARRADARPCRRARASASAGRDPPRRARGGGGADRLRPRGARASGPCARRAGRRRLPDRASADRADVHRDGPRLADLPRRRLFGDRGQRRARLRARALAGPARQHSGLGRLPRRCHRHDADVGSLWGPTFASSRRCNTCGW